MTPKVVHVMWTDAGHISGWSTQAEVANWSENEDQFIVKTAGHLIGEHEDWILVALSFTEAGMIHSPKRIMRASILDMEVF